MYGFDYTVIQRPDGEVVTVIKLVLKDSPAFNAGLERGMVITKINGKTVTAGNAESLTSTMKDLTVLDLTVGNWNNNTVTNEKEIKVYYGLSFEQPLLSKIFEKTAKRQAICISMIFRMG